MLREVKGRDEEKPGSFYGKLPLSAIWAFLTIRYTAESMVHCPGLSWNLFIHTIPSASVDSMKAMGKMLTIQQHQTLHHPTQVHQVSSRPRIT